MGNTKLSLGRIGKFILTPTDQIFFPLVPIQHGGQDLTLHTLPHTCNDQIGKTMETKVLLVVSRELGEGEMEATDS